MCVYILVYGYIFRAKEPYFPVFIYIGITMWRFFSMVLKGSASLLKKNKPLLSKIYFPKQLLLIISMLVNGFKALISMGLVFVMMLLCRIPFSPTMLLVLPAWLLLFLLTYGLSCFLMHLGLLYEDVSYVSNVLLTLWMYFTGTFWSIENRLPAPYGTIVSRVNPAALCISLARNGLLYDRNVLHWSYFLWLFLALVLCWLGTRLIYRNENTYVKVL